MARKIVLDVDTGVDDALAILLALASPELEILAITCVAGNVTLDQVVRNTLAVLNVAGRNVPVAVGARKPLANPLRTATYFHGRNGLADLELTAGNATPVAEDAPSLLARLARQHPGEVSVVAVGPLTNLALALLNDEAFRDNVGNLILMGGAVSHPGNATGAAEANFSNDPEAAAAVVSCGAPLQLVDLGATNQAVLPEARLVALQGHPRSPVGDLALRLLEFYGPVCRSAGAAGAVLHDPLAVALAARPELGAQVPLHLAVETAGNLTRGACVGTFARVAARIAPADGRLDCVGLQPVYPNATLARTIDTDRFLDLFLQRLELA